MRIADGVEAAAGYWLPSEFLTDDDFLMDKENFNNELDADFCYFPYHFQTQKDHLLQKFRAISASPPSNLRSSGGSNLRGAMDAKYDAVGDLIYFTAGQVTTLKLNHGRVMNSCPPPRNLSQFHKEAKKSTPLAHLDTTFENIGATAVRGIGQVAWPPHQIPTQRRAAAHEGGAVAARKACAGTGVFLPRRYDNVSDSNAYLSSQRRSPGCLASPFHGRASAQTHSNPSIYRFVESQLQPRTLPKIGRAFVSDHNSVVARRQALVLMQQRRSFYSPMAEGSSMISCDHPCLPHEWTY